MSDRPDDDGLEPARYEAPKPTKGAFAPRFPWKYVVPPVLLVVGLISFYLYRDAQRIGELRVEIAHQYDARIEPDAARIRGFREQIERWVTEAATNEPETWADERLLIQNLHDANGVYLRISAEAAESSGTIEEAAAVMGPDAITRCLGIAPASLRRLYEGSGFVKREWLARVNETESVLRLRVIEDELNRHADRDLPVMTQLLDADYFLLVLQHGPNRRENPVDVYLWDLRRGDPLLRTRAQASGMLIPVRMRFEGVPRGTLRSRSADHAQGAADCSIAAHVKSITGEEPISFGSSISDPPLTTPRSDAGVEGDGGAGSGGDSDAGTDSAEAAASGDAGVAEDAG